MTISIMSHYDLFHVSDEDLAKRVAAGLAIDLPAKEKAARAPVDLKPSDALSIQKNADDTMEGRKVAILFAEGSDKAAIDALKATIEKAGGTDTDKVAAALRSNTFDTPTGQLTFDEKGDLKDFNFVVYEWHQDGTKSEAK